MELPITAFDIKGLNNDFIKLEILEIYGFPAETSFRGGYDIKCRLEISCSIYHLLTDKYFSSTGALLQFLENLNKCYKTLNGKCSYNVYLPENDLSFDMEFNQGKVTLNGKYRDDIMATANILYFQINSDQSYFIQVINDLKTVAKIFQQVNKKIRSKVSKLYFFYL